MEMIKKLLIVTFIVVFINGIYPENNGKEILTKVDEYRNYLPENFSMDFTEYTDDGKKELYTIRVYVHNTQKVLCSFLSPSRNLGQYYLMLNNYFWFFEKGMNSPIRISPRQMIMGSASSGDISRIVFSDLYSVTSITDNNEQLVLNLEALPNTGFTYEKMVLTINSKNYKAIKAECYSKTNILLKTINYLEYTFIKEKELLTRFEIINELTQEKSIVHLDNFAARKLPATYFNKDYMKFLNLKD
ncbi:MAG: outer membrane lipoprotein-sorting protein [Spirochaetales bacterium]|nr:outer membrane lipoprotein-sorting protein [Spirochaetales bacterium]